MHWRNIIKLKPIFLLKKYAALLKCFLRNEILFRLSSEDKILLDILNRLKETHTYKFETASFADFKFYFYKTDGIEIALSHFYSTEGVSLLFNNELSYHIRLDRKPIERFLLKSDKYGNYDVVKKYFEWLGSLSKS